MPVFVAHTARGEGIEIDTSPPGQQLNLPDDNYVFGLQNIQY